MLDVHLQLTILLQLSIHLHTEWPSAAIYPHAECPSAAIYPQAEYPSAVNYPSAAVYPHAGRPSDWRVAFICNWACCCDGVVFWGLRRRWMAWTWTSLWRVGSNVRTRRAVAVDLELLGDKDWLSKIWKRETEYWEVRAELCVDDASECVSSNHREFHFGMHARQSSIWLDAVIERDW